LADENFHERSEQELSRLSDEQLVGYLKEARSRGCFDAMTLAVRVLAFGYIDNVRYRVMMRVPSEDVLDVTMDVMVSAMKAAFDGESTGEFRSWLNTITQRRVADYHRRKESRPDTVPLPEPGNEDSWGQEPSADFEGTALDAQSVVDTAMAELSDAHSQIVDLYIFEDRAAADVATECDTSEANVHQVASRFRKRVRELLDDSDTAGQGS
jgi:RNA polymerase sigma factor (sigma-70 family)